MINVIEEAEDLFEKAERESDIDEKSDLFIDAMEILNKCSAQPDLKKLALETKRKHIKMFLDQIVDLPLQDTDEIEIMEMVFSMGDMLDDILENEKDQYKAASDKLITIGNNYIKIMRVLKAIQHKGDY